MARSDTATARVTVTLDIAVHGSWGENCTIGQLRDQATESARNVLTNTLEKYDVRIIGQMQVTSVTHVQPEK